MKFNKTKVMGIANATIMLGLIVALIVIVQTEEEETVIPDISLDMIWIEPGTFMMGSSEDELGRDRDEKQHQVTLAEGYWMGKYEITQAQYKTIMKVNPSNFIGDDLPVETVSWNDAMAFCKKLTKIEKAAGRLPGGYEYRLPTEAQWEYACRAGTTTALNSGKNLSDKEECPEMDEVGWYNYNSNKQTHPVGQKQPNAWGLYDMHGNVDEWCLDWYGKDYPTLSVIDPPGASSISFSSKVWRGGSYHDSAARCRSARRNHRDDEVLRLLGNKIINMRKGFRVVLVPVHANAPQKGKGFTTSIMGVMDLDMVWCPPGTFTMGCAEDVPGQPQVTLTGYWLGKYEVTQAQYEVVMGSNPSTFKGTNLPVESVSWRDAIDFCARLTELEKVAGCLPAGYEYTLPTEAQWEYACRAGTTTDLNSGKDLTVDEAIVSPKIDEVGWYEGNSNNKTHPVGQKPPNAWGIYDMHGGVDELCLSWQEMYYYIDNTKPSMTSVLEPSMTSVLEPSMTSVHAENTNTAPYYLLKLYLRRHPYYQGYRLKPVTRFSSGIVARGGNWNSPPHSCCSAARRTGLRFYPHDGLPSISLKTLKTNAAKLKIKDYEDGLSINDVGGFRVVLTEKPTVYPEKREEVPLNRRGEVPRPVQQKQTLHRPWWWPH